MPIFSIECFFAKSFSGSSSVSIFIINGLIVAYVFGPCFVNSTVIILVASLYFFLLQLGQIPLYRFFTEARNSYWFVARSACRDKIRLKIVCFDRTNDDVPLYFFWPIACDNFWNGILLSVPNRITVSLVFARISWLLSFGMISIVIWMNWSTVKYPSLSVS